MAATVTQLLPGAAFQGKSGMRAAGVALEEWSIVTGGGDTTATVTTAKITRPPDPSGVVIATLDGVIVTPTTKVITPLGSGVCTIAFTGLSTSTTYLVWVRGSR